MKRFHFEKKILLIEQKPEKFGNKNCGLEKYKQLYKSAIFPKRQF